MLPIRVRFGMAIAVVLPLVGCGGPAGPVAGTGTGPTVVTSAYPFQFVAERVAGAAARVSNLTAPGAEPHDLELTPRQVGSVAAADLVVYERGFQPAVDEAVSQGEARDVLDTSTVVPLEPLAATEEHPADDSEEHRGHEHGTEDGLDPHVWLDPTKLAVIADAVAERLAALDPEQAATYRANADRLKADLERLDGEFRTDLTDCDRTAFITSHAAFGYLAKRYGLEQISIGGLSPDVEPSPARIAQIQTEAKEHQVTTIFTETLVSSAVADAIAGDLGLSTDVLDPVEGITDASRGRDYLAVMHANLTALQKANGCPSR